MFDAVGPGAPDRVFLTTFPRAFAYSRVRDRRRPILHLLVLSLILAGAFMSYMVSEGFPIGARGSPPIIGLSLPGIGPSRPADTVLAPDVMPDTVRREEMEVGLSRLAGIEPPTSAEGEAVVAAPAAALEPPFQLYAVSQGDTASAIAARFGVDLQYLLWANPDLRDGELLTVGQMLVVPADNGILATIRYGETLSDIAVRYAVSLEAIIGWPGNGISSADDVLEGEMVLVPGGVISVIIAPEPTVLPVEAAVAVEPPAPVPAPPPPVEVTASIGVAWPASGPISSYMDGSHPLGIDIDLFNNTGTSIAAATSGTITFAGGTTCCSYGLYVIVMSPDGIETLYAHLSSIAVVAGQAVSQGQSLGTAGCTGYCTGTHLHFEVIDNGVRVNPLNYLS